MLKNGLDPKRQTRGHKTVDFAALESGTTSIHEVSRDNAERLVRAIKLRDLGNKGPFGDKNDEGSAGDMWAWYYYHKTLALAPRAKHSISVPTVAYAIDMLQLLSEKQQETHDKRRPKERDPQKAYTKIKITLEIKNNTNPCNTNPQKKSRKEQRLQNMQRSKSSKRNEKRRRKQQKKNK